MDGWLLSRSWKACGGRTKRGELFIVSGGGKICRKVAEGAQSRTISCVEQFTPMHKPHLTFWQLWNMSFGFLGIQFGWGLQQANMSAIYTKLGADPDRIPFLWLAGSVTGLLVQPIIGSMSDRTWNRLGRRRPYFLTGAILSSIALYVMPTSSAIWMAASLLWILDASINVSMEPFRAFVADKLNTDQRTAGFVMQSFLIGVGASCANAMPHVFHLFGVTGQTASGIPLTVQYSFRLGAALFLLTVLWTVFTSKEFPPEDMAEFERMRRERSGFGAAVKEIFSAITEMPRTMKQLAVVQIFTWLGLFCMWMFFGLATAQHVFGATDPKSAAFDRGIEWGGTSFACYSVVCFLVAFALPRLAALTSRKFVHATALACGGLGLLSTFAIRDPHLWLLSMVGVGIAWASILTMPYAMLAGALPPARMGVYMGVFNFFIVIPEIIASLTFQPLVKHVFHNNPLSIVMLGGACLLVAALSVTIVRDDAEAPVSVESMIAGDRHEHLSTLESAQPVPSTGLLGGDADATKPVEKS
jgi:maltose/moltooligosaccharide transporter